MTDDEIKRSQELFGKTETLEAEIKRLQEREWQGLTDEEAFALIDCLDPLLNKLFIIRAIEARIKEKNNG